jgi:hypothetical protein
MNWNRGNKTSTWVRDHRWILDEIVAFFKKAYAYDLEMSNFALTEKYAMRGTYDQYAVLDLSGAIRSTAYPETAHLVVHTITEESTLWLFFEGVDKRSRHTCKVEIPTDPALRSTWLQDIMGTFFDPSANGRAILERYDEEVARKAELQRQKDQATSADERAISEKYDEDVARKAELQRQKDQQHEEVARKAELQRQKDQQHEEVARKAELQRQKDQATKEMKAVMVKHMKTCWTSIVAETRPIPHVDALSEFDIQEEMKRITILAMNSISVHRQKEYDPSGYADATMDDGPARKVTKLESHLGDLMKRCERLGL